jgi:hypothetical protein
VPHGKFTLRAASEWRLEQPPPPPQQPQQTALEQQHQSYAVVSLITAAIKQLHRPQEIEKDPANPHRTNGSQRLELLVPSCFCRFATKAAIAFSSSNNKRAYIAKLQSINH